MKTPTQSKPNCKEMIAYLVNKGDYNSSMSRDELMKDSMLQIVSSACGDPLDAIIKQLQDLVISRERKNSGK